MTNPTIDSSRSANPPQPDRSGARRLPANFCNLRHTNEEFILDLGMSNPDPAIPAQIDISLVVSPFTAKRLWMSLGSVVANYEQSFGGIEIEVENRTLAPRPVPIDETPNRRRSPLATSIRQFTGIPPYISLEDTPTRDVLEAVSVEPPIQEFNGSPCIPAGFRESGN